jgi:DNA polymerase I-like protein with 3'-5' exonuclease and polymerase domains
MIEHIKRRGLWEIYEERLKLLPIAFKVEDHGVTLSGCRSEVLKHEYQVESALASRTCRNIARKYGVDLRMPKSGNSQQLTSFCFKELDLPIQKESKKTGNPSLDKEVLSHLANILSPETDQHEFVQALLAKRKRDTALTYMEGYKKFRLPLEDHPDWYVLHPWLNPTGTATLRWSSQNPNEQNISKQEGFNLRLAFGPKPGREWWSLDAKNLELRLPAYEANEKDLIYIFENPEKPPYFGSYHLAVFDALYPELYKEHGKKCKDLFESTYYQWVKNGNFAMIYGCQEKKADETYHQIGAYQKVRYRFPKIAELADFQIAFAERHGYVETMPDRSVNPKRGYPLWCARTEFGRILPTTPLNYHIQGTACWWMGRAMVRVDEFFTYLNDGGKFEGKRWDGGYFLALQVHDELVPDMPSGEGRGKKPWEYNFPIAREVARLMALGGEDIGVPTPVGIEYNQHNWAENVVVA